MRKQNKIRQFTKTNRWMHLFREDRQPFRLSRHLSGLRRYTVLMVSRSDKKSYMIAFDSNVFIVISRNTGRIYAYFKKESIRGKIKLLTSPRRSPLELISNFPLNIPAPLAGLFNTRVFIMGPEAHHHRGPYVRAHV